MKPGPPPASYELMKPEGNEPKDPAHLARFLEQEQLLGLSWNSALSTRVVILIYVLIILIVISHTFVFPLRWADKPSDTLFFP